MTRTSAFLSMILIDVLVVFADEPQADHRPTPREQYQSLVEEYKQVRLPRQFAPRFFELAKNHVDDPVAIDALAWVVTSLRYRPEATEAIRLLEQNHLQSENLTSALAGIARVASPAAERFLRTAMKQSPHVTVRAQACFFLTKLLDEQLSLHEQFKKKPAAKKQMEQYYGKELTDHIVALNQQAVERQRQELFEQILESFANVETADGPLGKIAERALFAIRHLSVGEPAPEIEGEDIGGQTFRLSDYRGKIVLLSFWGHW
jgi:hypothetical protein